MYYSEPEARRLLADAGRRLLHSGLVARTWGNLSARISETEFLITPSGRAYESLTPEDMVLTDLEGNVRGSGKPSSEKGIHAEVYRLHPDAAFVIHTHQFYASALCAAGKDLPFAPCAGYGLPGTGKLKNAVSACMRRHPDSSVFLLEKHGALCFGKDAEEAFSEAERLEDFSRELFTDAVCADVPAPAADLGCSVRNGNSFTLTLGGTERTFPIRWLPADAPSQAALHACIYASRNVRCIRHETDPLVVAFSRRADTLPAWLDDFAQIIGPRVRASVAAPHSAVMALEQNNAVLLLNYGALCTAESEDDLDAVSVILRKTCAAALYENGARPLGSLDSRLQRFVYRKKYARKKDGPC